MSLIAVGGAVAVGAVKGLAGDSTANQATEAQYIKEKNAEAQSWATGVTNQNKYVAETTNSRATDQWMQDNNQAVIQGQATQSMWDSKYAVGQAQTKYDALTAEFGDLADNIGTYFKTLSPSSIKAQNNDAFNSAYQTELEGMNQSLTEMGINPGSGFSAAMKGMLANTNATQKVLANRNAEAQVAQQQAGFLDYASNNILFGGRPNDFNSGILDQSQVDQFAPTNPNQITDTPVQGYDVQRADIQKGPEQTGGALTGAIGGALGSLFG